MLYNSRLLCSVRVNSNYFQCILTTMLTADTHTLTEMGNINKNTKITHQSSSCHISTFFQRQKETLTGDFLCCWHKSCWDLWGKVSSLPLWLRPGVTDESDSRRLSTQLHDTYTTCNTSCTMQANNTHICLSNCTILQMFTITNRLLSEGTALPSESAHRCQYYYNYYCLHQQSADNSVTCKRNSNLVTRKKEDRFL